MSDPYEKWLGETFADEIRSGEMRIMSLGGRVIHAADRDEPRRGPKSGEIAGALIAMANALSFDDLKIAPRDLWLAEKTLAKVLSEGADILADHSLPDVMLTEAEFGSLRKLIAAYPEANWCTCEAEGST